nr:MAG TPA: hypothetical protein [Caudoviricetes sp.]
MPSSDGLADGPLLREGAFSCPPLPKLCGMSHIFWLDGGAHLR